ncbi:restriction endonuclease subunit S [Flavobacterium sp. AJR]|uniref:restriction endonuclease subunit S n=1 Tax=Flavobacterium sp. AJR TaxID=1979369 RepID=UPI000A3D7107|nr:restriction endonuclease subunit S [Flavobacterium sp. AJR]OUL63464.1 hypothetical protein B8T70_05010 [Flavobacterium sp. AJR]
MVKEDLKRQTMGLLPEDWELLNLEANFTLKARIGWQGLTTAEYLNDGDYGLVTGTDFKNGYIDWDNCVFVEKMRFDQDRNIQLKKNDVLVTKDGTIGKIAFIDFLPKPTTLNSGVFVVRPKSNNINNRFFYYILMSFYFDDFLLKITAGSTIIHLYQKDFVNFNFVCPPLPEQEAIAEVLSDCDAWVESLEKIIAKKRLIKQGAMQELLTPKENWEVKKLGEVAQFLKGKGLPKSELDNSFEYECIHYGELFTRYKELIGDVFSRTNSNINAIMSKHNDVLMPTSDVTPRGLATASCIKKDGVILGGDILIIRFFMEIDGLYFSYFISNNKEEVLKFVSGSTVYHLYGSELSNLNFEFPTLTEQTRIATILSDMDAEIDALEKKLNKARQIKQGMMQELLTGRVRLL